MVISVEPLSATRAYVVIEPSLAARIVYGKQIERRLVVKQPHGWIYAAPADGWVGMQIESEIDDALQAVTRG